MSDESAHAQDKARAESAPDAPSADSVCPVCGGPLISEKCKVVCRSERCRYRIVFNCAEF
jgi:hypothetical protein